MENRKEILIHALRTCGAEVTEEQAEVLLRFHDLLIEKNKVMNLTAITEFQEAVWKHYADSLAALQFLPMDAVHTALDVGSGAGLPGIPIRIVFPQIEMTLLDAVNKKVRFHEEVIEQLQLEGIHSVHLRSEDAAHSAGMREQYDLVTARAVANLATLSEYCLPFVKIGGLFAAYKAETAEEEQREAEKAIRVLGGRIESVNHYTVGENKRCLILIRKEKTTPKKYPRKAGTPSKEPIK